MSDLSGKRLSQKKPAPLLLVVYVCRDCGMTGTLDAYNGPPSCEGALDSPVGKHRPTWMEPLRIVGVGSERGE